MYCIDASVIVNSQRPEELHSSRSGAVFNLIEEKNLKVFLPEIVVPEITSALVRSTRDLKFAYEFSMALRELSNFSFVPIDNHLANLAAWVICKTMLKSSDALYVALAFDYDLELITLDKEQLERGEKLIKVRRP
ncbi:type II toxin-antitoxin system VapC family toxin [Patescibacteria group bacterium]|nr:type II toxin-antitoxin system VapC family toxin [Patescibacteria group bacterium]MBU4511836.1 type II toxin-antitoxin system VapC family toxin [Patescibacteria group bacterium]MCG2693433.1 type II toxin-antitoxin system VapC family toxin [Candidatus Parcubacteria bacterium]